MSMATSSVRTNQALHLVAIACGSLAVCQLMSCGASADRQTSTATFINESCQRSRGCPQPKDPPQCDVGRRALGFAEAVKAQQSLIGQQIAVRGYLIRRHSICTSAYCGNGCCNRCSTTLGLSEVANATEAARASSILIGGVPGCRGDESLQCCEVEPRGQPVVVHGTLQVHGDKMALEQAKLCLDSSRPESTAVNRGVVALE
jgi:hypothetical protein